MSDTALQIFTGNANPELAQEIVEFLGMELSKAKVSKFKDGEVRLEINEACVATTFLSSSPPVRR